MLGDLVSDGEATPVAMFLGRVGLSHRGRDEVERRFQNPGGDRPIVLIPGRQLILLGLWDEDPLIEVSRPLLVSADPVIRLNRTTRFSVFTRVPTLIAAQASGWAEERNSADEQLRYFSPPLLGLSHQTDRSGATVPEQSIQTAIASSGLLSAPLPNRAAAVERVRRAGTVLVRDARFSRAVIDAYDGRCAMCGLDVGLVEGAHIYPAAATGAQDQVWNGLALCANHHRAFDRHLVGVDPNSGQLRLHDLVLAAASSNSAAAAFSDGTFEALAQPIDPRARPASEMFVRRFEHFEGQYNWLARERA